MIDRKEFAEELILRENVRKAIRIVLNKRNAALTEESKLREIIRSLMNEGQAAVAAVAKHDSTGINALEDLLKNTNVLSTLETGYKSLTTDKQQRDSYRNHILNAVEKALAPEESRKGAGEDEELGAPINEEVDIEIGDRPEDDPDFINVEDEEVEEVEEDPKDSFGIEGEDKTGRNRAFTDFQDIEKNILTAFDDLDNPEDITMFEEYLLKNLSLYFDKFESELQVNVDAPELAQDATPDSPGAEEADLETEVPEFELQEVSNFFDLESLIENLLK
tara:strand:- start:419 stop:1249 length:831 start_codon:yes stop_codon:yes gene_type:complete